MPNSRSSSSSAGLSPTLGHQVNHKRENRTKVFYWWDDAGIKRVRKMNAAVRDCPLLTERKSCQYREFHEKSPCSWDGQSCHNRQAGENQPIELNEANFRNARSDYWNIRMNRFNTSQHETNQNTNQRVIRNQRYLGNQQVAAAHNAAAPAAQLNRTRAQTQRRGQGRAGRGRGQGRGQGHGQGHGHGHGHGQSHNQAAAHLVAPHIQMSPAHSPQAQQPRQVSSGTQRKLNEAYLNGRIDYIEALNSDNFSGPGPREPPNNKENIELRNRYFDGWNYQDRHPEESFIAGATHVNVDQIEHAAGSAAEALGVHVVSPNAPVRSPSIAQPSTPPAAHIQPDDVPNGFLDNFDDDFWFGDLIDSNVFTELPAAPKTPPPKTPSPKTLSAQQLSGFIRGTPNIFSKSNPKKASAKKVSPKKASASPKSQKKHKKSSHRQSSKTTLRSPSPNSTATVGTVSPSLFGSPGGLYEFDLPAPTSSTSFHSPYSGQ